MAPIQIVVEAMYLDHPPRKRGVIVALVVWQEPLLQALDLQPSFRAEIATTMKAMFIVLNTMRNTRMKATALIGQSGCWRLALLVVDLLWRDRCSTEDEKEKAITSPVDIVQHMLTMTA
jgi:hypothetical protein